MVCYKSKYCLNVLNIIIFLIFAVIDIQVIPSNSASPLLSGQTGFYLRCNVSGTENLNSPTITYQWKKSGSIASIRHRQTLRLSPLAASHAGHYTCIATIQSNLLQNPHELRNIHPVIVTIQCKYNTCLGVITC